METQGLLSQTSVTSKQTQDKFNEAHKFAILMEVLVFEVILVLIDFTFELPDVMKFELCSQIGFHFAIFIYYKIRAADGKDCKFV